MRDVDSGRRLSQQVVEGVGNQLMVPILTFRGLGNVLPVVDAIEAGGLKGENGLVVEVTIRDPKVGFEAVGLIRSKRPHVTVMVGSVLTPEDLGRALDVGGQIIVSPGAYPELYDTAQERGIGFLPGIKTSSEAAYAVYRGIRVAKLYKSSKDVFDEVNDPAPAHRLWKVPTGGITLDNAQGWLDRDGVPFVAASCITQQQLEGGGRRDLIKEGSVDALALISGNSRQATGLRRAAMSFDSFSS